MELLRKISALVTVPADRDALSAPCDDRVPRRSQTERLIATLRHVLVLRNATTIERGHPQNYREGGLDWLPRRAELTVVVAPIAGPDGWREAELELGSGPDGIYRYFPFASFVYVDGRLEAILEFSEPHQRATAMLRVPAGRACTIAIITELASVPDVLGDERELALLFWGLRAGRPAPAPAPVSVRPAAIDDYYSQHSVPLVDELPRPVFVLGSYRSATSILTWAIGQHPNIWPLEETGFLGLLGSGALAGYRQASNAARNFFQIYDVSGDEYLASVGASIDTFMKRASERRAEHIALERIAEKPGRFGTHDDRFQLRRMSYAPKRRWVDGTPENTANVAMLRKLFPLAQFVCTVRHPYDVIASMLHFDRAGGRQTSIDEAVHMWTGIMTWALLAAQAYGPEALKIVMFDDLKANPARALGDIFSFIGEPQYAASTQTFSQRINTSRVDPGEYADVRARLEARLGDETGLLRLYETFSTMSGLGWSVNAGAQTELDERQNDLLERLIAELS